MIRNLVLLSLVLTIGCTSSNVKSNQKKSEMKYQLIKSENANIIDVAPEFRIFEYGALGEGVSNGTVALVTGRYPLKGWGMNKVSDEIVYVISGEGFLEMPLEKVALSEGDVAFVPKGQPIAWSGDNLKVFIPCIPGWTYQQHVMMK